MYDTSKMEIDIERAIVALLFTQKWGGLLSSLFLYWLAPRNRPNKP